MIDGDSSFRVYVACPLRSTRPLCHYRPPTPGIQHPAPRFRPSSLRSPRGTRYRPSSPQAPFGASKRHSLKRLQSHELNEYCTTPFCNGAFQGEIRYTGAPSRVTYGTLAYLIRSSYHFIQGKICVVRTLSPTALTISYDLANLLISLLLDAFESFSEDSI